MSRENDLMNSEKESLKRIQDKLNAYGLEEVPLPPPPPQLLRSEIFRGSIPKKSFGIEGELIGQRVLCSWVNSEEKDIVNLQSGILKYIDFVNGKKFYYVAIDFKDYTGKVVTDEFIMHFPAELVRIEATDDIVYPSKRDSTGHITENESDFQREKREREEEKLRLKNPSIGGKKRKTYKKHKKTRKTRKTRNRRRR